VIIMRFCGLSMRSHAVSTAEIFTRPADVLARFARAGIRAKVA